MWRDFQTKLARSNVDGKYKILEEPAGHSKHPNGCWANSCWPGTDIGGGPLAAVCRNGEDFLGLAKPYSRQNCFEWHGIVAVAMGGWLSLNSEAIGMVLMCPGDVTEHSPQFKKYGGLGNTHY